MFANLIESASHQHDLARKGRFFLATLLSYALIVACAGVASIYAYDAQLVDNQDLEFLGLVPPIVPEKPAAVPKSAGPRALPKTRQLNTSAQRIAAIDRIATSTQIPRAISADKLLIPEIPDGIFTIGPSNKNATGDPTSDGTPDGDGTTGPMVKMGTTPPPVKEKPVATQPTTVIRKSVVLNGEATFLPKPPYPPLAKITRVEGQVSVQVMIDESGKIVSARASQGHPTLTAAAVRAAYQARFNPTRLNGVPVKVSGVIVYNFKLL